MNLDPKKYMRIAFVFFILGFAGLMLRLVFEVFSGRGFEYYMSGLGYQLTPVGVLILIAVLPVALIFGWIARRRLLKEEKDFKARYGAKKKS